MIEVSPFRWHHLEVLRLQGVQAAQARALSHVPPGYVNLPAPASHAVTAHLGDRVLLCGGIVTIAPKRGLCWAVLGQIASRHMLWLHYAVRRFMTMDPWQRLEATVEKGFAPGCRWVELLGFHFEGEMPAYGDQGETHLRYGWYG